MSNETPVVYCIVLNFENPNTTIRCLESLARVDSDGLRIVVIDNDSGDNSRDGLSKYLSRAATGQDSKWALCGEGWHLESDHEGQWREHQEGGSGNVTLIRTRYNGGFASGCNAGIRYALSDPKADYIWLLNNDAEVEEATLDHLLACSRRRGGEVIAGSAIMLANSNGIIQCYGGGYFGKFVPSAINIGKGEVYSESFDTRKYQLDFITGCSMLVPRMAVERAGLLDESYFLYWEDAEWCQRFKKHGCTLDIAPKSRVWHVKGDSTRKASKSAEHDMFNCLRTIRRYSDRRFYWYSVARPLFIFMVHLRGGRLRHGLSALRGYIRFLKWASMEKPLS